MSSSADEAREVIADQRKHLIEIDIRWLFKLADWIFSYPPRKPFFRKIKRLDATKSRSQIKKPTATNGSRHAGGK
jgi:hypothetical protein